MLSPYSFRVAKLSERAYVSSVPVGPKPQFERALRKTIHEAGIVVVPVATRLGMVRARKKIGAHPSSWQVERFGAACLAEEYCANPHAPD